MSAISSSVTGDTRRCDELQHRGAWKFLTGAEETVSQPGCEIRRWNKMSNTIEIAAQRRHEVSPGCKPRVQVGKLHEPRSGGTIRLSAANQAPPA